MNVACHDGANVGVRRRLRATSPTRDAVRCRWRRRDKNARWRRRDKNAPWRTPDAGRKDRCQRMFDVTRTRSAFVRALVERGYLFDPRPAVAMLETHDVFR
jgi:hypothetical protein